MSDSSGHLDGPPPGPPDPPYIPGDLGAPSPEEFARRRASSEPRPENPYRALHARMSPPGAAWDEGFLCGLEWSSRRMIRSVNKIADLEVVDDSDVEPTS